MDEDKKKLLEELLSPEEVDKMLLRDILGEDWDKQSQITEEQNKPEKDILTQEEISGVLSGKVSVEEWAGLKGGE